MNYKNTTILITIFALTLLAGVFVLTPTVAHAQLVVDFEEDPLFNEANFLPGNEVERDVDVTNNTDATQTVLVEAINAVDDDGLGDELDLVIKEGETTLYSDTLGDFLRAGEIELSDIDPSGSTTYSFGITFKTDADDDTQATALGFDICVGFEGGDSFCGDTVVGGEGGTDGGGTTGGGGGSTGGGGGGGGGPVNLVPLEVFSEEVTETNNEGATAIIEWDSNLLSTSQVIYGKESDGPFSLNLTVLPYFGYPLGTVEDFTKVTHHAVTLTGLEVGTTYVYRVVSRASPPTVGFQYTFALNEGGGVTNGPAGGDSTESSGAGATGSGSTGGGSTGASSSGGEGTGDGESFEVSQDDSVESDTSNLAAAGFLTLPTDLTEWLICLGIFLLILFVIYLVWLLVKKLNKDNVNFVNNLSQRRSMFFLIASIVAVIVILLLGYTCAIIPLLITAIVALIIYFRARMTY